MIPRYTRAEMAAIWDPQTRYRIWFEIEAHAADAMAELGIIPKQAAKTIWSKGKGATFDVARIDEIEREVKHDVVAFLTHLAEIVGPEARFVHQGMTSSDVLDTCLNVQLVRPADILIADVDKLNAAFKRRALEHKHTATIGRSHGIHAEPTTFGLKLASAYAEFSRGRERLVAARREVATSAISGAVGTFAQIDPRVEAHVAKAMGLAIEPISTQVIPRDRHAMYFATLAVVAASVERLATEIRHLQRTEVLEAEEFFSAGQKGSSAMPHKRNPVLSEDVTGLARMVRAYVTPALENVALWHERDISHSSVERMIGPDATATLDFALARLAMIIDKLVVYPDNMRKNLERLGGLIHSQRVLIALTQKGVAREDAYRLVQRNAMRVWQGESDFLALLKADPEVRKHLSEAELQENFDLGYHFKHVDTIFERVFGKTACSGPSREHLQELPHRRVELARLFPVHETAGAGDRRRLAETLHAGQDLGLVRIGIVRAAQTEHRQVEGAEGGDEIGHGAAELEHAATVLVERVTGEQLDHLLAHGRVGRDDAVDGLAALRAQQRDERVATAGLEHLGGAAVVLLPTLEILPGVVHLAPGREHQCLHAAGILDGIVRCDRGAEGDGDDHRLADVEVIDQMREIAGLVDQREAVIGELGVRVATAIVGKAAVIAGKFRNLIFPIVEPVDLAVDEHEVGPLSCELVVEVAAIGAGGRHEIGLHEVAADYRERGGACQRDAPLPSPAEDRLTCCSNEEGLRWRPGRSAQQA